MLSKYLISSPKETIAEKVKLMCQKKRKNKKQEQESES